VAGYFPSKLSGDGSDDSDGSDGSDGRLGAATAGAGVFDTTSGAAVAETLRGGTRMRLTKTGAQPFMPQTFRALAAVPKAALDKTTAAARTAHGIWRTDSSLQSVQR
jgi:hypothetical protein